MAGIQNGTNQIVITGVVTGGLAGPPCNWKILDGWWQNYVVGDTLKMIDTKGRTFVYEAATNLEPVAIGKLDWVSGPLTVFTTGSANQVVYLVNGNK